MPENCNAEVYKKWRHDVVVYLEAHPKWAGAKRILGQLRKSNRVVDSAVMDEAIRLANADFQTEHGRDLLDASAWNFDAYSRELYQVISVKLNSGTC